MFQAGESGNISGRPKGTRRKAKVPAHAVCVSLEAMSERAVQGDVRSQELLVESVIHLERYLKTG